MFENFKKITIEGGYFENPTELELFKGEPLSIVYGRNGSGKTTIARCLRQLSETEEERAIREEKIANGDEVSYDVSSEEAIDEDLKKNIKVFDEDFVRDNVRTKGRGLETIVMMGEQVELDEQIDKKEGELKDKKKEYEQQEILVKKYENQNENISPLYYWNQIRSGLREDGGWADIDRDLKGNAVKSRVTDDVVSKLLQTEDTPETYEQLRNKVLEDMRLYLESANAQPIEWVMVNRELPESLDEVGTLLKKALDSPELSEREQRLMTLLTRVSGMPQHFEQHQTRQMLDEGWGFCPLCLREIEEQDKQNITETLTHILNKEADEFEARLKMIYEIFAPIEIQMPVFPGGLNEGLVNTAIAAREALNAVLVGVRERIELRLRNIYQPLAEPYDGDAVAAYEQSLDAWAKALAQVGGQVTRFNETVKERNKLYEKVRKENFQLARKQLNAVLNGFQQAQAAEKADREKLGVLKGEKETLEAAIKQLKAQKERTDIALDYINQELQYVFYSGNKVKLVAGENCYVLKINGQSVSPKKISVGERNVLGLCYFFAKMFSDKKADEKYKDASLIVIDDPVSSFDYGNRLGVMSLLRYQFSHIVKGNEKSRILVMSHDLRSVFDLVKVRSELKGGSGGGKHYLELAAKTLKPREVQNEYMRMVKLVFDYAKQPAEEGDEAIELGIGNVMRRVIEAFASFSYNKSFEEMMCMEGVLGAIEEEKRDYYENFMCRLALNGESHAEERVYDLNTITPFFTKEEKVKTAKSLLLFLSYINKEHLNAYLGKAKDGDEDRLAVIESWKTEEGEWIKHV